MVFEEIKEDEDAKDAFIHKSERILTTMSSEYMELIRAIFWDQRPRAHENLHSTMQYTLPTRYFFQENLKFCKILEKSLVGLE